MRKFILSAMLLIGSVAPAAALQSDCLAMAGAEPRVVPAAYTEAKLAENEVKLTFIGHSSFIIESPGGIRIVTDYSGYSAGIVPDGVTMNRAHSTHYTDYPDPAIKHVIRGWNPDGDGPAVHDVEIGDIRVRNVTTDLRGGMAGRMKDANSIFIFEVAGLCIGHLGHLHHLLGAEHMGMIGRLDIVMVPVDGGYTMGQVDMLEVLRTIKARVVIPMHFFGQTTLNRFISNVSTEYELETSVTPERIFTAAGLPDEPKLLVLPGN
jgi:L-ascorbate metabolism protein UlaG (beta-lactamase superfamily)